MQRLQDFHYREKRSADSLPPLFRVSGRSPRYDACGICGKEGAWRTSPKSGAGNASSQQTAFAAHQAINGKKLVTNRVWILQIQDTLKPSDAERRRRRGYASPRVRSIPSR